MDKILTREQLILLVEKTVEWEKSALGVLTSAVFKPITWLTGSIKTGVKKRQLTALSLQWGIEYVKALKAFDLNEEVQQADGVTSENETTAEPDETTQPAPAVDGPPIHSYLKSLESELAQLTKVKNILSTMNKWVVPSNDAGLQKIKTTLESIGYQGTDENILRVLPSVNNTKKDNFNAYFDSVNSFIDHVVSSENGREFAAAIKVNDITKFRDMLADKLADLIGLEEIYGLAIDAARQATPPSAPVKEGMINEASEYKLPQRVEDLLPITDLEKFKKVPDIKKNSLGKINFVRLDTIKYEANYILEKAKTTNENVIDLRRTWDVGVKNVNDYFQDVIDVSAVMSRVTGNVPSGVKNEVNAEQEKLDALQNMGITETFPTGQKFDPKKLYAFDCNILGQNNKGIKAVLLMSPTKDFVESVDKVTFYWFKLLGAYTWDDKAKKTVRVNLFENITQNKKISANFGNVENAYYVALRNLRPAHNQSFFWVYSNTGKFFFKNDIHEDVGAVVDQVKTYKADKFDKSVKNIANDSNIFRIKVNQRFLVSDADVAAGKFPGIQQADLVKDKGFENAKTNHDKLINALTQ